MVHRSAKIFAWNWTRTVSKVSLASKAWIASELNLSF